MRGMTDEGSGGNRPGLLRQVTGAALLWVANRLLWAGLRLGGVMSKAELRAAIQQEEQPPAAAADLDPRLAAVIARRRRCRALR